MDCWWRRIVIVIYTRKLVNELILTVAPTILGKGIPLFKDGDYQLDFSLKELGISINLLNYTTMSKINGTLFN